MGFRTGTFAKVWEVKPISDKVTQLRISISRKPKGSDEYVQDFSGYGAVIGTAPAKKAVSLVSGDTIQLGDVDVTTTYDKEKKVAYTNYSIYSFSTRSEKNASNPANDPAVVDVQDGGEEGGLPW